MPTLEATQVEKVIYNALEQFGAEPTALRRDASLEELDVDSLDLVEVAQIVEEEFGVELQGEDVKDLRTVGQVIDLVVQRAS
jgi:acyl carrier protein